MVFIDAQSAPTGLVTLLHAMTGHFTIEAASSVSILDNMIGRAAITTRFRLVQTPDANYFPTDFNNVGDVTI